MNRIPTLADLGDVSGRRVLVRTDFNVPLEHGVITDDFRIRAALPTIEWLTSRGAHVVCASHLGRPKGQPNPKYSMDAVRSRLAELAPEVELMENLRFDPGEEGNDPQFVASLIRGITAQVIELILSKLPLSNRPPALSLRPQAFAMLSVYWKSPR